MRRTLFVAAFTLAASIACHADTIQYTESEGGTVSTFEFPQQPTLLYSVALGFATSTEVTTNGQTALQNVYFSLPGSNVCFFSLNATNCDASGTNIYFTGTASNPTLLAGTFTFQDNYNPSETVTVEAVDVAATPEPSSIALLGTGLLGVAGVVRKRLV